MNIECMKRARINIDLTLNHEILGNDDNVGLIIFY